MLMTVTSSNGFFCPTNGTKPKDSSFTVRNVKEMQQIDFDLTFLRPKPANI